MMPVCGVDMGKGMGGVGGGGWGGNGSVPVYSLPVRFSF